MALVNCHECGKPVSTEAATCPNCGAPVRKTEINQPANPPAATVTQPAESRPEETLYSDNQVTVTTTRVIIGKTTYALRNITSVKPIATSPSMGCAIVLLLGGLLVLFIAMATFESSVADGLVVGLIGAAILTGAIFWLRKLKPTYHVQIASASGEAKALSSPDNAYIQKIVASINDAIVKYR